jgi:hypothetical protein
MRKSKFSEHQIIAILKAVESLIRAAANLRLKGGKLKNKCGEGAHDH